MQNNKVAKKQPFLKYKKIQTGLPGLGECMRLHREREERGISSAFRAKTGLPFRSPLIWASTYFFTRL